MSIPNGKHNYPKISIVTPSFNQGQYLEKTILSVLEQNYPNLEHIIIDGGSTDNSVEIIKKYEKHLKYWVSEPDRGQSHAINKGFKHATGNLMTWLNSDDFLMPGALHKVADIYRSHPEAGAIVGAGQIIDTSGKVIYYKEPPENITVQTLFAWMDGNNFTQPSCFFTKEALEKSGHLDEDIHIALDVDLWIRIAKSGFTFVTIHDLLSTSLKHKDAKTKAYSNLMIVDCSLVVIRHGGEHVVRKHLEELAQRLTWAESNLRKIIDNPLFRAMEPIIKLFVKPAVRWRDAIPNWSRTKE